MKKKIYKDVKSFVVDRKDWLRGQDSTISKLLTEEGKMCCLGFYAKSCGLRNQDIRKISAPDEVVKKGKDWRTTLVITAVGEEPIASKVCLDLMRINDDPFITDNVRETKLTKKFAKAGIKVKFKG